MALSDERWLQGMDTCLLNVVRPTRLVVPRMQRQGRGGAIINISSAWALEPSTLFPASSVMRAGLAAFTRIFVDSFSRDNIRMNGVLPGWIDSLPEWEARRAAIPMARCGRMEASGMERTCVTGAGFMGKLIDGSKAGC